MELTSQQDIIIRAINKIREKHHACTAKSISRVLQLSHGTVIKELVRLNDLGKVTWTNIPGSLRTIPETTHPNPELQTDESHSTHEAATPPQKRAQSTRKTSSQAAQKPTKKATSSTKKATRQ